MSTKYPIENRRAAYGLPEPPVRNVDIPIRDEDHLDELARAGTPRRQS